jgi:hypothetical protein
MMHSFNRSICLKMMDILLLFNSFHLNVKYLQTINIASSIVNSNAFKIISRTLCYKIRILRKYVIKNVY